MAQSTVKSIGLSARSRVSIPILRSVCIPTIARDHVPMCEYKSRELTSRMAHLEKCNFFQFVFLNPSQSLVFLYLGELLFQGLGQFGGNFLPRKNDLKYHDIALSSLRAFSNLAPKVSLLPAPQSESTWERG